MSTGLEDKEPPFRLVDPDRARAAAHRLFEVVRGKLAKMLPATAEVLHIGATAVPGCLTKGDLDILVRIPARDFEAADAVLAALWSRNKGSIRTDTFAAFEDCASNPHLGVQLAVIDGPFDHFHLFVEALRQSPQLIAEYNDLKRRYDGADMQTYRAAKDIFVDRVLTEFASRRPMR